jgi:hypothetical protein
MATDRQIAANRRNGALSRGPKTPAGKARSSRNAFKHGLSIAVTRDKARSRRIEVLARKLAQSEAGHLLAQARVAAEAEVELGRVRAAFEAVLAHAAGSSGRGEGAEGAAALTQALPELEKLDRYERRALSKRRRALRGLLGRQPKNAEDKVILGASQRTRADLATSRKFCSRCAARGSKGLKMSTSRSAISETLRVASVNLCTFAGGEQGINRW